MPGYIFHNKAGKPVILILTLLVLFLFLPNGCTVNEAEDEFNVIDVVNQQKPFVKVSPYQFWNGSNQQGLGFDFVFLGLPGGAKFLDEENGLQYDLVIRSYLVEFQDSSYGFAPGVHLYLSENDSGYTQAFNASTLSTVGYGMAGYNSINSVTADLTSGLRGDSVNISLSTVPISDVTGLPVYYGEYGLDSLHDLLVIGDDLFSAANTADSSYTQGNQPVWIIKTREGYHAKFLIEQYPALGAPDSTTYMKIHWEVIDLPD